MRCPCIQPELDTEEKIARDHSHQLSKQLKYDKREEEKVVKLLLLGTAESGKSTMTKQMKIIHINGYTNAERCQNIPHIRKNLRDAILSILGAMDCLTIQFQDPESAKSAEYIMSHATVPDSEYSQEFYQHVKTLWEDDGVQACFRCSTQYQLIDSAKYLLDRVDILKTNDYIPSDQDILRCRIITNNIQKIEFKVPDGRSAVPFRVYDVGGQRGERQKWIQGFDMCTAILFLVDAGNFDLVMREDSSTFRLLDAAETFEKVWNSRWLRCVSIIIFINKIDILEEKISNGKSFGDFVDSVDKKHPYYQLLQQYHSFGKIRDSEKRAFVQAFPSLSGPSRNGTECPRGIHVADVDSTCNTRRRRGFHVEIPFCACLGARSHDPQTHEDARLAAPHAHIQEEVLRTAVFIKRFFVELTQAPVTQQRDARWHDYHTCEYYYTCAVDTDTTRKVLEGCKSLIIKKHMERYGMSL